MTKRIYKWTLELEGSQFVEMPGAAEILCVQVQHGQPCLWALCDPEQPSYKRDIRIHGTGHPLPAYMAKHQYIGTFQLGGGDLVFHVFEVK